MAKQFPQLNERLTHFIGQQPIFFVSTAPADGRVNCSPKGMQSLRVLSPSRIAWLNVTGSGNETAAHVLENGRMTIMWCAFEGPPLILRAYGTAKTIHPDDPEWAALAEQFPTLPGARQIFDVALEMVQTSCGMAVPQMDFREERDLLNQWAGKKSKAELADYWAEKNTESIDGKPTGIIG